MTLLSHRLGKAAWLERRAIENLPNFRNRTDFTDAEKAALELAERVTRDPHEVDDEFWAELRKYYDEGEIIELSGGDWTVQLLQSVQ